MPALYALGQHPALVELQRHLRSEKLVFAYLDDIYVIIRELGSTDGSVTRPCRPSNRGSLRLRFPVCCCSLLQGIRSLPDRQSAWLLLLFCASPRCCHLLLSLPPVASLAFAEAHDAAVAACLADLLGAGPLPDHALRLAPRSGRLLGLVGRHSSRAAPPAPALRRRCRQACSRRARRPQPPRRASVTSSACCGRV